MIILNTTNNGQDEFVESLPDGNEYILRTTYVCGITSGWLLDIYNIDNEPILLGIRCVCGADLFRGQANRLNGMKCYCCVVYNGSERSSDALGSTLFICIQSKDEDDLLEYQDRFDMLQFVNK